MWKAIRVLFIGGSHMIAKMVSAHFWRHYKMTDDIVTRLRKAVAQTAEADTLPSWDFATVVWEAADEIERLRAEVVRLGSFIHPIGTVIGREAVRGD
jgi:hypothetical protein